jgi:hypothetical protein
MSRSYQVQSSQISVEAAETHTGLVHFAFGQTSVLLFSFVLLGKNNQVRGLDLLTAAARLGVCLAPDPGPFSLSVVLLFHLEDSFGVCNTHRVTITWTVDSRLEPRATLRIPDSRQCGFLVYLGLSYCCLSLMMSSLSASNVL